MPRSEHKNDSFLFIHCPPTTGHGPKASPNDMTAILRHVQDRVRRKRDKSPQSPDFVSKQIPDDDQRAAAISNGSKMITISLKTMKAKTRRSHRKAHRSTVLSKSRMRSGIICSRTRKHNDGQSKIDEIADDPLLLCQRTLDQRLENKLCIDFPLEPSSMSDQHTMILQNCMFTARILCSIWWDLVKVQMC